MSSMKPVPGAEDLWPHVSIVIDPGDDIDGEMVCSIRVLALLLAPDIETFATFWNAQEHNIIDGIKRGSLDFPPEWQRGAKRHSKELQAKYGVNDMVSILRCLHDEYGVLPPEPVPAGT